MKRDLFSISMVLTVVGVILVADALGDRHKGGIDEIKVLRAKAKMLESALKSRDQEIRTLKKKNTDLLKETERLRKLCEKHGIKFETAKSDQSKQDKSFTTAALRELFKEHLAPGKETVRIRGSLIINNLKITVRKVSLQKLRGTARGVRKPGYVTTLKTPAPVTTPRRVLVLICMLENVSKGEIYKPWTSAFSGSRSNVIYDDFGNRHKVYHGGSTNKPFADKWWHVDWKGRTAGELKPGQKASITLVAENPRVDNYKAFLWPISFRTSNKGTTAEINVLFTKSEVKRTR